MESIDLYHETKQLLAESTESIPEIAEKSGVNRHWLGKFKQGKYPNPGVLYVQRLYDYLTSEKQAAA